MRIYIKILSFLMCCCFGFVSAQSIEPSLLKYNCRKLLCEKENKKPYSGKVEGFLSSRQSVNVANIRVLAPMINTWHLSNGTNTEVITSLYLKGDVIQGKETGLWFYYTEDKTLLAEIEFVDGYWHGKSIIYYSNGNISIAEYKNGKLDGIEIVYDKDGKVIEESMYENGIWSAMHKTR